jgi:hypothetical protein
VPWTKVLVRGSAGNLAFPFAPPGRQIEGYKVVDGESLVVEARISGRWRGLSGVSFALESLDSELCWRNKITVNGSYVVSSNNQLELLVPLAPIESGAVVLGRGGVEGERMHLRGESLGLAALEYVRQATAEQPEPRVGEEVTDLSRLYGVKIPKSNIYVNTGIGAAKPQPVLFRLPGSELVAGVLASRAPSSETPTLTIRAGAEEVRSTHAFRCWLADAGQTVVVRPKGLGLLFPFHLDKPMPLCFKE